MKSSFVNSRFILFLGLILASVAIALPSVAQDVNPAVKSAEAQRVAVIEKARPSVVAIFGPGGQGGGSGVLIDKDGYALTNCHVGEGAGRGMQCCRPGGGVSGGGVVGLDQVGDVALPQQTRPR